MKHIITAGLFGLIFLMTGCVMNKLDASVETIVLEPDNGKGAGKGQIIIDIKKDDEWSTPMKAGPLIFNVLPQMVFWLENNEGDLVRTLYVTGADYKKMRHGGKSDLGEEFYPISFPLWSSKMEKAGLRLPSEDNPFPDTVTSATPSNSCSLVTGTAEVKEGMVLFAEINKSGDTNSFYTKEKTDWAGQPALLYSGEIINNRGSCFMELKGHSGVASGIAGIYEDISRHDTALGIIKSIQVRWEQ